MYLCGTLFLCFLLHSVQVSASGGGSSSLRERPYMEVHHSVFGSLPYLEPEAGACSMLIIVGAVIVVEKFFHILHRLTHDTPFQDMVSAIEKELMIVGCMAFIFKVLVNAANFLSEPWLEALEYADMVIPVTSFCLCSIGLLLILTSIHMCKLWNKAYHLHMNELLEAYFDKKSILSSATFSWLPLSTVNSEMEFRIFHCIFCDTYKIQKKAFAFDAYVHRHFERCVLRTS